MLFTRKIKYLFFVFFLFGLPRYVMLMEIEQQDINGPYSAEESVGLIKTVDHPGVISLTAYYDWSRPEKMETIVSGSSDNTIKIWHNLLNDHSHSTDCTVINNGSPVSALCSNWQKYFFAGGLGFNGAIKKWEQVKNNNNGKYEWLEKDKFIHGEDVSSLIDLDGGFISIGRMFPKFGCNNNFVNINLPLNHGDILSGDSFIDDSNKRKFFFGSVSGSIFVLEANASDSLNLPIMTETLKHGDAGICSLKILENKTSVLLVAGKSNGEINIWHRQEDASWKIQEEDILNKNSNNSKIMALAIINNTIIVSAQDNGVIKTWEEASNNQWVLKNEWKHGSTCYSLASLSDGVLVSAGEDKIKLWQVVPVDPLEKIKKIISEHGYLQAEHDNEHEIEILRSDLMPPNLKNGEENFKQTVLAIDKLYAVLIQHENKYKKICVKFTSEQGQDAGGLRRTFVDSASKLCLRILDATLMHHKQPTSGWYTSKAVTKKIKKKGKKLQKKIYTTKKSDLTEVLKQRGVSAATAEFGWQGIINDFSYSYFALSEKEKDTCHAAMYCLGRLIAMTLKDSTLGISFDNLLHVHAVAAALGICPSYECDDSLWRLNQLRNSLLVATGNSSYFIGGALLFKKDETKATYFNDIFNHEILSTNIFKTTTVYEKIMEGYSSGLSTAFGGEDNRNSFFSAFTGITDYTNYGFWLHRKMRDLVSSIKDVYNEDVIDNKKGLRINLELIRRLLIPDSFAKKLREGFFYELDLLPEEKQQVLRYFRMFSQGHIENFLGASGANFTVSFKREETIGNQTADITGDVNVWMMDNLEKSIKEHVGVIREHVISENLEVRKNAKEYLKKIIYWMSGGFLSDAQLIYAFKSPLHVKYIQDQWVNLENVYSIHTCYNTVDISLAAMRIKTMYPFYAAVLARCKGLQQLENWSDLKVQEVQNQIFNQAQGAVDRIKAKILEDINTEPYKDLHATILDQSGIENDQQKATYFDSIVSTIDVLSKTQQESAELLNIKGIINNIMTGLAQGNFAIENLTTILTPMIKNFIDESLPVEVEAAQAASYTNA
jgi:WD40 repeat protein